MFLLTRRQKRENTSADNTHPVGEKKRKDNILIKIIIKEISYIYIFVVLFKSVLSEQFQIWTKIVKVVNLEPLVNLAMNGINLMWDQTKID